MVRILYKVALLQANFTYSTMELETEGLTEAECDQMAENDCKHNFSKRPFVTHALIVDRMVIDPGQVAWRRVGTAREYTVWYDDHQKCYQVSKDGNPPPNTSGGYPQMESLLKLKGQEKWYIPY